MKTTVSFEFDSADEAASFLDRHRSNKAPSPELVEKSKEDPAIPGKPEASAVAPARRGRPPKNPAQEASKPVEPTPAITGEATETDVQKALEEVFNAKGINMARDLISRYGVKRLAELKREKFAEFVDHAKRVLAGEPV